MKFCGNCGSQLNDDVVFCPNCGAKTQENAAENGNQQIPNQQMPNQGYVNPNSNGAAGGMGAPVRQKKPMSKKTIGIIIAAVVALVIGVIAIIIVKNMKKTINVSDYISVEFTGYDTVGKASVKLDEEKFLEAVLKAKGKKIDKKKDINDYTWSDLVDLLSVDTYDLLASIEADLDKEDYLSNGDEVTVTITYDEEDAKEAGIKIKDTEKKFTVEGLADIQEIDPFAELSVTYEGIAPNVRVVLQNNATDDVLYYLSYQIEDEKTYYDEGDVVKVKISDYDVEDALLNGYKFTETEKEYTIDQVDRYQTQIAELTEENLAKIQAEAEDTLEAYLTSYSDDVVAKDSKYVGAYLLTAKDQDTWGAHNYLYVVYSATVASKDKDFKKTMVYYPVEYYNVILKADGTIEFSDYSNIVGWSTLLTEDGDSSWYSTRGYIDGESMYKEIVTSNRDDYKYEVSEALQEFGN